MSNSNANDIYNGPVAFEEFQLFHETTEKVTDRRLSMNRWNYSICSAIIVGVSAVLVWGIDNYSSSSSAGHLYISFIISTILCVIASVYCLLWIGQLDDFKILNNAKYDVLSKMTKNLVFSSLDDDIRRSFDPFDREWEIVKRNEGLSEIYSNKLVVLKSSNIEYMLPKSFLFVYSVVAPFGMLFLYLGI